MNPASRLALELGHLRRVLPPAQFRKYCLALARHAPTIARERTLAPADRSMGGTVSFRLGGAEIRVPVDEMERLLAGYDNTPTFGGAREMYAGNVYLRGFRTGLKAEAALDLGSNRGLFLLLAAKLLGARTLIGVEPQAFYTPVVAAIVAANGMTVADYTRYERFIGSRPADGFVTLGEVMHKHGLERLGFVKCDIEGGEFDVLLAADAPLDRIDNLAMELHPEVGDVGLIVAALKHSGFALAVTDQFGGHVEPSRGHYLYASRTGDLSMCSGPAV